MTVRAIVLALLCALAACTTVPGAVSHDETRTGTALSGGWLFRFDDDLTPQAADDLPVSQWSEVSLPHTWNRLGEYRTQRTAATDNRQGTGWYRRTIDGRALNPARRHFVEFDAVGNVADVWLNGRHLGRHAGAFTRFRLDLTDALDFAGENLLLVRADNSDPKPGSSTAHVIPLLGDFFVHGGIYRPARIVSVGRSHIALDDFGGPGLYAVAAIGDKQATIDALVRLTGAEEGQQVRIAVRDREGKAVASTAVPVRQDQREARAGLTVPDPHRWNGRADPYLYRISATLEERGRPLDRVDQPLGIREFRMDPDRGFFLNGKSLPLHGVSRHQDRMGQGWALTDQDNRQDMALIAEMGANSVRVAHYPQAGEWFDLADEYGMVAWAELPFVNKPSFTDAPASAELVANAKTQMTEMIRQHFNHPSIVTWGIGNEVDIDLAFKRLGPKADARPLLRELNALSHAEDPSRPTVIADCCEGTPGDKAPYLPVLTGEADLMGYNRYFGWYYGEVGDLGPHLDMLHARHPSVPLSVSEFGAGGALTQHSADPEGRPTNVTGRPQPEEFQAWWHEQTWPQIRERRYLWGSWIWNMFDFSSRVRQEGDATDINTKGLVSFDRKTRKDAFWYYKAQWSAEPMVHITGSRFEPRSDPAVRIKVYSNADAVDLTLNGKSVGSAPCLDRICVLDRADLVPGTNVVTASAIIGGKPVIDTVTWKVAEPIAAVTSSGR